MSLYIVKNNQKFESFLFCLQNIKKMNSVYVRLQKELDKRAFIFSIPANSLVG